MIYFPNSKINLGLKVVEKRPDGFHNIESIFYPIPFGDSLEINEKEGFGEIEFKTLGLPIPGSQDNNLIIKVYKRILQDHKLPSIRCTLLKIVPMGAGLGGGSADAAYMIKGLNEFFKLNYSQTEMEAIALEIGSDCPFFIQDKPVFIQGQGELMTAHSLNLQGKIIVLVCPEIHISTVEAFKNMRPQKNPNDFESISLESCETWQNILINDFEEHAFNQHPELKTVKENLIEKGAFYASMTGSGSAVYGLFDKKPDSLDAFEDHFIWTGIL